MLKKYVLFGFLQVEKFIPGVGILSSSSILHHLGLASINDLAKKEIAKRLTSFDSENECEMLAEFVEDKIFTMTGRIQGVEWGQMKNLVPGNKKIAASFLKYVYFSRIGNLIISVFN